jgi:TetR/AcrR family transcriptional repressor of nem operon
VATAAREFRNGGLQGIGIADLMSQVGLTHGGFYAHFKDRDALVAEASVHAAEESFCKLAEAAKSAHPGQEVEAMLDFYLSPAHRDNPGFGCLLPALGADLSRQSKPVRRAFTNSLKANMGKIARYMPGNNDNNRLARAMMFVSSMAGGILLARTINDPVLSNLLLASVRTQLLGLLESWRN